jgi:uncharacterized tellurite resistance protein B-like protein
MGFWKTLGYIAGGIGTGVAVIVAAPIAGSIGAITLTGALIAGGTGATVGGVILATDNSEENAKEEGFEEGKKQTKSENHEKIAKLLDNLKKHEIKIKENNAFEEYTVAMFAVAFSVAKCDGQISADEVREIEEFISGETFSELPTSVKSKIEKLKNSPPNFNTAMEYVKKVNKESWDIFDNIIQLAMYADGIVHENETAYINAWKNFKNVA